MGIEGDGQHPFGAFQPSGLPDIDLAELATVQDGIVDGAQLSALGFSRREIQRRLQSARLHRLTAAFTRLAIVRCRCADGGGRR